MKSPHRVILASAGTGKTFRLSSRYLHLVAAGEDPANILATTFTRKAAGEILERIFKRLAAGAMDEGELKGLRESVDPSLTSRRCAELTALLARRVHRLNIGTIDAFFGRVLRAFGMDLGIQPGWQMVSEEADTALRAQAVQTALASPELDGARAGLLLRMLKGGAPGVGVFDAILAVVDQTYSAYLKAGDGLVWEHFGPAAPGPDHAEVELLLSAVRSIKVPLTKAGAPNKPWANALASLQDNLSRQDWSEVLDVGLIGKVAAGDPDFSRVPIPKDARVVLLRVYDAAARALLQQLKDRNIAVRQLMSRFDRVYQELKTAQGWLRFDDVPRLLHSASTTDKLDDLYFRLDGRINHILLDEFQDTSLDQFQILHPIVDEVVSQGDEHESRTFLCVGDVKQSLYSWRGAEPELLPALTREWPQLEQESLSRNFRSSPKVLDAVNRVFGAIASNVQFADHGRAAADRFGEGFHEHIAEQAKLPGEARLVVAPAPPDVEETESKPDRKAARAHFVALRIAAIRTQSPSATIAVLTRTNAIIARIIFELRELGIPAAGERGNPLTDSPAASAAISALQLAEHPGDTGAWFHVATSPLGPLLGVSADSKLMDGGGVASRLRARIAKAGIAGLLQWMQLRLASSMDAPGFARFDQLVNLGQEWDREGGAIGEFVERARSRAVEPPKGLGELSPVRVMTVHMAKGLEFDAVLLPELDKEWKLGNDAVLIDRRDGRGEPSALGSVTAVTTYPNSQMRATCKALDDLYRRTLDRAIGEELCGLYVGMTRAKRYVEMIVDPTTKRNSRGPTAAKVLCESLAPGQPLDPGAILWSNAAEPPWHEGIDTEKLATGSGPVQIRFAVASEVPSGRLKRRSPSSLEGGSRIDLGDLWRGGRAVSGPGANARDRGTAFHAMFEQVEWLDGGLPGQAVLLRAIEGSGVESPNVSVWIGQFLQSLRGGAGDALRHARYSDKPGAPHVRREWSFAMREQPEGGDPLVLSGQFDRLVVGMKDGTPVWAEVLDFKTDDLARGDEPALAKSVEFYRPQIEAYKRAAGKLLRLNPSEVTAALIFLGPDRIMPV